MIINHNMGAMNANRNMNINSTNANRSMEKLSSGMRINKAGDDAAGLAISEKMRGQIRGLDQASSNAQDAISLIGTAEGGLNETHSILQRMRELAVQSSSDTQTDADRTQIQKEMTQLSNEVGRIADTTQFNTKTLLNGDMGKAVNSATANINTNAGLKGAAGVTIATGTTLVNLSDKNGNSLGITATDKITMDYTVNGIAKSTTITASGALSTLTVAGDFTTSVSGTAGTTMFTAVGNGTTGAVEGMTITVKDSAGVVKQAATNALSAFQQTTTAADKRTDGQATFQIGANTNQNLQLDISDMGASALGVKNLSVTTQTQANIAIKVLDTAIQTVSGERSKLGAYQNRLEHTIANLGTSSENLTSAESRIRDVDMAKEMSTFSKNNILSQAAQAMLAQANQQPQQVLQLLR